MISPDQEAHGPGVPGAHLLHGLRVTGQDRVDHLAQLAAVGDLLPALLADDRLGVLVLGEHRLQHLLGDLAVDAPVGEQAQQLGEALGRERASEEVEAAAVQVLLHVGGQPQGGGLRVRAQARPRARSSRRRPSPRSGSRPGSRSARSWLGSAACAPRAAPRAPASTVGEEVRRRRGKAAGRARGSSGSRRRSPWSACSRSTSRFSFHRRVSWVTVPPALEDLRLAGDLVGQGLAHELEGVEVLHLYLASPGPGPRGSPRRWRRSAATPLPCCRRRRPASAPGAAAAAGTPRPPRPPPGRAG